MAIVSVIKKQHQQQSSKTTTKRAAPTSYSCSTPILNRLRVRPNGHIAAGSPSSSTSLYQPVLTILQNRRTNKQLGPKNVDIHRKMKRMMIYIHTRVMNKYLFLSFNKLVFVIANIL